MLNPACWMSLPLRACAEILDITCMASCSTYVPSEFPKATLRELSPYMMSELTIPFCDHMMLL